MKKDREASDKGVCLHLSVLSINKHRPAFLLSEVFIDYFFCISMRLVLECISPLDAFNLSSFYSLFC